MSENNEENDDNFGEIADMFEVTDSKKRSAFESIMARAAEVEAKKAAQLPAWPEAARSAPNEILRSALFGVGNKVKPRENFERRHIPSYGSGVIEYTGKELRQDDLDVWLQLIQLAQKSGNTSQIEFDAIELKKEVGIVRGKIGTDRLLSILTRLQATSLRVSHDRLVDDLNLSLIYRFTNPKDHDDDNSKWMVTVDPALVQLFGDGTHTALINWAERKELAGDFAKWLHGFYCTHRSPGAIRSETLIEASGATFSRKSRANQMVRDALAELERVGAIHPGWEVTSAGLVTNVVRTGKGEAKTLSSS